MKIFTRVLTATALVFAAAHAQDASSSGAGTVTTADTSSSGTTTSTTTGSSSSDFMSTLTATTNADSYHMKPVHVVQARVQSDEPLWNAESKRFGSKYYDTAEEQFIGLMDTVNTASVEGALMYVQAEGINYNSRSPEEQCTRKNEMTYVVFYEFAIAQTNETLALYQDTADQNEYGPMLPMDSGRCTPTSEDGSNAVFPTACYYFNGDDGQPNVGPFVGGELKTTDPRAPYPNNVWYSFPNSCPLEAWGDKTEECRASTRHGLCDMGVMPDGIECTFNYRVLGYLLIDDLVGITSMTSNTTGEKYANFTEFCEDGGVEFKADVETGEWEEGIEFWNDPQDEDANAARAQKLVEAYNAIVSGEATTGLSADTVANFLPLPSVESLRAENPACYYNVKKCNSASGCVRELYGQTCTVCNSTSTDCETPPSDWTFPELEKAVGDNGNTGTASADGSTVVGSSSGEDATSSESGSNGVGASFSMASAAITTALVALSAIALN